jgi:hypothetical protein
VNTFQTKKPGGAELPTDLRLTTRLTTAPRKKPIAAYKPGVQLNGSPCMARYTTGARNTTPQSVITMLPSMIFRRFVSRAMILSHLSGCMSGENPIALQTKNSHISAGVRGDRASRIAGLDDGSTTWRELRALNQLGVIRGTRNLL